MSTTTANALLSEKNDGGSVLSGGSNSALNTIGHGISQVTSMKPVDGDDTDKALSGGEFAYDDEGNSIVAKRVSSSLAGVANDFLLSGAAVPSLRKQVHKIDGLKSRLTTTAMRAGEFNYTTGQFNGGFPALSDDTFGDDDAVTANELEYMDGSLVPNSNTYGN